MNLGSAEGGKGEVETKGPTRWLTEEGRVVRVRADGVVAFVPKFGLEGPAFYADAEEGALSEWGVGDPAGVKASGRDWVLSGGGTAAAPPGASAAPAAVRVFDRVAVRIGVDTGGAARRARVVLRLAPLSALEGGGAE